MNTQARPADQVLRLYQRWISPLLHGVSNAFGIVPAGCRYQPTCSEYAREALARYGVVRGGWLALRRLLRCHPLGHFLGRGKDGGSFDPVP
jgi:putative membrane protein insertion efficiency factor